MIVNSVNNNTNYMWIQRSRNDLYYSSNCVIYFCDTCYNDPFKYQVRYLICTWFFHSAQNWTTFLNFFVCGTAAKRNNSDGFFKNDYIEGWHMLLPNNITLIGSTWFSYQNTSNNTLSRSDCLHELSDLICIEGGSFSEKNNSLNSWLTSQLDCCSQ